MIVNTKMTSKNQITIPKAVRDRLQLDGKDTIVFFDIQPNSITIEKGKEENLWQTVKEQEKKYGSVATAEVDWGEDVGEEELI